MIVSEKIQSSSGHRHEFSSHSLHPVQLTRISTLTRMAIHRKHCRENVVSVQVLCPLIEHVPKSSLLI